jgi:hypothetical protein
VVALLFGTVVEPSLGYTYYKRQIDTDELENDVTYNIIIAILGYTF